MWDGRSFILWNEQGLTPFVPHHTSPPCMETQGTPTLVPNHPSPQKHNAVCYHMQTWQQHDLLTQRREMGGDTEQGVGPITAMLCRTHQWVHWCACLTSKQLLLHITFPLHCMAQVALYLLTPVKPTDPPETHVKTCRNPYSWVPVQVQVLTGMGMGTTKGTWGLPIPILLTRWNRVTSVQWSRMLTGQLVQRSMGRSQNDRNASALWNHNVFQLEVSWTWWVNGQSIYVVKVDNVSLWFHSFPQIFPWPWLYIS